MRLLIGRTKEQQGAETFYVLRCAMQVPSPEEQQEIDAVPAEHWRTRLINRAIDVDALRDKVKNYVFRSRDVFAVQQQEQYLRDAFSHLEDYIVAARAFGGNEVVEAHDLEDADEDED